MYLRVNLALLVLHELMEQSRISLSGQIGLTR